ncbi:MAG: bifunctional hydroxymethylpyrimidine kinase/phosphomethylpyrimidine kinase [Pseudanabaenaceae cyanobacterium bins.68]|nr:bifunctional hydroxymethylpyrimidine kinase/phosphomethylpyrimidine kinase [Pseudanabaenaceae cyanobacterium bins.68]
MTTAMAMTIAGSDSGGGAGIQADLKAFTHFRVHGTCALTCVTAQNTCGVRRVDALSPEMVVAQIDAVTSDMQVGAIKTGMLLNQEIIEAIALKLRDLAPTHLVVDPVMVSRAGVTLIDRAAIASLTQRLLPLALVVTPNRYEAEILAGIKIENLADMQAAAQQIWQLGAQNVLVKGGAMTGNLKATDVWFDGASFTVLPTTAVDTPHTHGTGCTLSAAIAANLALELPLAAAITRAKDHVSQRLKFPLAIGQGQGTLGFGPGAL